MRKARFQLVKEAVAPVILLTPNQVRAIRSSGRSASSLAKQYNVAEKEIRDIQSLKTHSFN